MREEGWRKLENGNKIYELDIFKQKLHVYSMCIVVGGTAVKIWPQNFY